MHPLRLFLIAWTLLLSVFAAAAEKVEWKATKPDAQGIVTLSATIEKGWHLYSATKTEGPIPTTIKALPPLTLAGPIQQSKAIRKMDPKI